MTPVESRRGNVRVRFAERRIFVPTLAPENPFDRIGESGASHSHTGEPLDYLSVPAGTGDSTNPRPRAVEEITGPVD